MNLKPTFYDVILNREPYVFDFIEKDILYVKQKKIIPPFYLIDQFSKHYNDYIEITTQKVIDLTVERLRLNGKSNIPINEISAMVKAESSTLISPMKEMEYIALFNFIYFGKKTFYFDNQLVEHLAFTKLDAPSELIIPPFDSCLFVYSSHSAIKALYNIMKDKNDIDLDSPISIFIANHPTNEGLRNIIFRIWQAYYKETQIFIKRELLVRKDWSIDEMLKTDWRDILRKDYSDDEMLFDESKFYNEGLLFFHILINSILYLGSNEPDVINVLSKHHQFREELQKTNSSVKIKNIKNKINNTTSLDFNYAGKNIGAITVEKPNNYINNDSNLNIKFRDKRFIVRGHWRRQHFGEGGISQKLIWIKPYFKGPELAQLINKPYNVK